LRSIGRSGQVPVAATQEKRAQAIHSRRSAASGAVPGALVRPWLGGSVSAGRARHPWLDRRLGTPPAPCTLTLTTSASGLGIKSGAGMYSITGLSTFFGGNDQQTPVLLRLEEGNSEQSDAAAPFDVNGTGTTSP
jgi:hypothetical protein